MKVGYKTQVREITVEAGKVTTLELTLSKPSISAEGYNVAGKVTTSDGADVSGSIVFLKGDEYDSGEEVGSDGSFSFSGVPFGTYIVEVEKYGYRHDPIEVLVGGDIRRRSGNWIRRSTRRFGKSMRANISSPIRSPWKSLLRCSNEIISMSCSKRPNTTSTFIR